MSGYTLEEIAARDPAWITRARALITAGRLELIGSGYSQMIGPLVPARVTAENLRLANEVYQRLLGACPRIVLVNEQAYAAGLVPLYRQAGYDAMLMDWENAAANHPEWPEATQYLPHYALGPSGERIGLLWSNTTLFQQMQRLAPWRYRIGRLSVLPAPQAGARHRAPSASMPATPRFSISVPAVSAPRSG